MNYPFFVLILVSRSLFHLVSEYLLFFNLYLFFF